MTALSGRDASGLALLAQCKTLSSGEKEQILRNLSAPAREIAKTLLKGVGARATSKSARAATVRYLEEWAQGLAR